MQPVTLEWDGQNVPEELRRLPPGRYIIHSTEGESPIFGEELTEEEEAGIVAAIEEIDAGKGIPLHKVMEEMCEEEWLREAARNPAVDDLKEPGKTFTRCGIESSSTLPIRRPCQGEQVAHWIEAPGLSS